MWIKSIKGIRCNVWVFGSECIEYIMGAVYRVRGIVCVKRERLQGLLEDIRGGCCRLWEAGVRRVRLLLGVNVMVAYRYEIIHFSA